MAFWIDFKKMHLSFLSSIFFLWVTNNNLDFILLKIFFYSLFNVKVIAITS